MPGCLLMPGPAGYPTPLAVLLAAATDPYPPAGSFRLPLEGHSPHRRRSPYQKAAQRPSLEWPFVYLLSEGKGNVAARKRKENQPRNFLFL